MRVACVATGWYPQTPGGLEKYALGLCRQLTEHGDSVDLFVTGDPVSWSARARVCGMTDPTWSLPKRILSARRSFAKHYSEPYDVLNLHFAMYALPLEPFISKRTPRVFNFQGPWAAEGIAEGGSRISAALKYRWERFVYDRADRFITLSTSFKDILSRDYAVAPERVSVVPMGIDTDFFVPASDAASVRRELGWPEDRWVVFTARRLVARVGLLQLIEAVERIPEHARRLSVKIAGKGPMEAELRSAIERRGLSETIELLGFVSEDDLVRAYQAADLTVLPTQLLEGFGTIISESLACGTPVLATPVGGMPEALAPFSPQLLASSARPDDLAAALDGVISKRIALPDREAARSYAVDNYSWPKVYARVRAVFEQAIREHS
jgi:glycosyltransferase involved in cell wall biosynthesis